MPKTLLLNFEIEWMKAERANIIYTFQMYYTEFSLFIHSVSRLAYMPYENNQPNLFQNRVGSGEISDDVSFCQLINNQQNW